MIARDERGDEECWSKTGVGLSDQVGGWRVREGVLIGQKALKVRWASLINRKYNIILQNI